MRKKRLDLPFIGIPSFCKLPVCDDWDNLDADVAILGVPFESTQDLLAIFYLTWITSFMAGDGVLAGSLHGLDYHQE
jgi:hypothetical protein